MKIAIIALLSAMLSAQQTATVTLVGLPVSVVPPGTAGQRSVRVVYAQQGAQAITQLTGRRIKGVAVIDVSICSSTPATIPAAELRQWGALYGGLSFENPTAVDALLSGAAASSPAQLGVDASIDFTSIGAGLLAAKIIATKGNIWGIAIGAAEIALTVFKARLQTRVPNVNATRQALLPVTVALAGGSCAEGLALARYRTDAQPVGLVCTAAGDCQVIREK